MDVGDRLSSWVIIIVLLLLAVFFSAAETAFASVSKLRLRMRMEKGDSKAQKALWVLENFDQAITTILICTNIVHLAAASIVTVNVNIIWGPGAVTLSTLVFTLIIFFFCEMLPKSIARKYSETLSLGVTDTLYILMHLLRPFSIFLTFLGEKVAGLTSGDGEASVTETELYDIIEDMTEEGTLEKEQGDLISSALQFGDVTVESILTSRLDISAVDIKMSPEEVLRFIKEQNHSRVPVYDGTIDNIIGILQIRKYLKAYIRQGKALNIVPLLDDAYFIHQSTKIDELLSIMSKKKLSAAIVTDNYGGTLGIVTVEDILEELVGEIWDEDDRVVENIIPLSDGRYSVNAEEHLTDVLDSLDVSYTEEQEEEIGDKQIGEFAYETFAEIPKEGDSFEAYGLKISVEKMSHHRILRLFVSPLVKDVEVKE